MNKPLNKKVLSVSAVVLVIVIIAEMFVYSTEVPVQENTAQKETQPQDTKAVEAKEFVMESFVEFVDGKAKPQFSVTELNVKKGDLVRVKIKNTKGTHDFKIDEFNAYIETPENEEVTVEFTADKAGEFIYYCTKPGHRTAGHWGTIKVTE